MSGLETTGSDKSGEPVPVRPRGRSEIASDPGSDRGWLCWIGVGGGGCCCCGCGVEGVMGLGVGRVRTRMRPWGLLGAETAE